MSLRPIILASLLASMLLSGEPAVAARNYLDYFYRDTGLSDPALQQQFQQVIASIDRHEYSDADKLMDLLITKATKSGEPPVVRAKLLTDAGIIKSMAGNTDQALALFGQSIDTISQSRGQFSGMLYNPLMAQGLALLQGRDYNEAMVSFRYAQHITHRQDGVYTRRQLPALEEITELDRISGAFNDMETQLRFSLRINERAYGKNSEALVPSLEHLGEFFRDQGELLPRLTMDQMQQMAKLTDGIAVNRRGLLFQQALDTYQRAVSILEDKYGPNDPRLVPPLKGLAMTRLMQGIGYSEAENNMLRANRIIQENPDASESAKARSLVDLADTFMVTGDDRAADYYRQAWDMMAGTSELLAMRKQLMEKPVWLFPVRHTIAIDSVPSGVDPQDILYVDARFSVMPDGDLANIVVTDANVPYENQVRFRHYLKSNVTYRPAFADGKAVETDNVTVRQRYVDTSPPDKGTQKDTAGEKPGSKVKSATD